MFGGVAAATTPLQNDMEQWFIHALQQPGNTVAFSPDKKLKADELADMSAQVWRAWQSANAAIDEERLPALTPISADSAKWSIPAELEPDAVLTFRYGSKGERPAEGYPLFLYLHGSGEPSREWANGLYFAQNFKDSPSVYMVPRIPNTGEWYRWYQRSKQYVWEKMIRQALASGEINPNRLYMFGISEGGYGSQRLASFYADYLAGAGPMAGGEPLKNAPAENCRNIAFSLRTGDKDYGFYRDKLTRYTREAFDSLLAANPRSYVHWIDLIPGKGHHIDYRPTTPWLSCFTRNPWPKQVSWEDFDMDGRHRTGFYNLQVIERPDTLPSSRTRYDMDIQGNTVNLTVDCVNYTTTETDPRWGIELAFNRSYTPATSGIVRIYLNSKLVNLNRDVTVVVNGRVAYKGKPRLTLGNLMESCAEYFDPMRLYPASVTVNLAEIQQ